MRAGNTNATATIPHTPAPGRGLGRSRRQSDHDRPHLVRVLGVWDEMAVRGCTDQRIAQVAAVQRGRVARRQLSQAGVTHGAIRSRLENGRLFRLHQGVYAVGHTAVIDLGDETAALLVGGESAVLSHESAAALWGLFSAPAARGLIHVTVREDRRPTLRGVRFHRSRSLVARDLRIRRGLPVTSPARALLDIAPGSSDRELELAFDRGLVDGVLRRSEVEELLQRTSGVPGVTRLGALLDGDRTATVTRSEAEERMLALIRSAQLPAPNVNVRLLGYEVDFHWPAHCLVVEVDGFRFHSTRRAFEHDRRKDAVLGAAGITTQRPTWRQLETEPYAVIARLAEALARSEHPPTSTDPPAPADPPASADPQVAAASITRAT